MTLKEHWQCLWLSIKLTALGLVALAGLTVLSLNFWLAWLDHADRVAEYNAQTYCTYPQQKGPHGCYRPGPKTLDLNYTQNRWR